jgi:hypothetical protein
MSEPRGILRFMGDIPDRLLGCETCGWFFRWIDDEMTLKDHSVGGMPSAPECAGSGAPGVDVGPRADYSMIGNSYTRALLFKGPHNAPRALMECVICGVEVSVRIPPDGAFNRRLPVQVLCPSCHEFFPLTEVREGPQGKWFPRASERR